MKPTALGRILIRGGSSLWIGQAGEPSDCHAHHAVQIALPFRGGQVSFQRPGEDWHSYPAAVIAPDQPHAFAARGQFMAQIFVEPESVRGRALQQRFRNEPIGLLATPPISETLEQLAQAYEQQAADRTLLELSDRLVGTIAGVEPTSKSLDPRIEKAIAGIRARLDQPLTVPDIAALVSLSPERFRHLFVSETGITIRPYLLWLRLELALAAYVQGTPLTEAASAAGFADSAHFSRTFRRMFGIAPVSIRPD